MRSLNDGATGGDTAGVQLTFLSAAGTSLGMVNSGSLYSPGGWQLFSSTVNVPVGATSVDYQMFFTRNIGGDLDAYVDDNSLILNAVPEPSAWALLSLGAAGAGIVAVRRRRRV